MQPGWEIDYACEFHMTNDSKHFPPLDKWEAMASSLTCFGRWVAPDGEIAIPFYQGSTINQFDFFQKEYVAAQGKFRPGETYLLIQTFSPRVLDFKAQP